MENTFRSEQERLAFWWYEAVYVLDRNPEEYTAKKIAELEGKVLGPARFNQLEQIIPSGRVGQLIQELTTYLSPRSRLVGVYAVEPET